MKTSAPYLFIFGMAIAEGNTLRGVTENNNESKRNLQANPLLPNQRPNATNDFYTVTEGQALDIAASAGFLQNDAHDSAFDLIRCNNIESIDNDDGDLDTDRDGSFTYTAPKCFTEDVLFTYTACYDDFRDLESNTATVTIRVERDDDRPSRPDADDDRYTVIEGQTLDVSSSDGLLDNDDDNNDGDLLFVSDTDEDSDFVGDLDVDDNGSFTYESIYGQRGAFEFEYEVCQEGWECVECDTATVTIEVIEDPNKPDDPVLRATTLDLSVTVGESLSFDLISNVDFVNDFDMEFSDFNIESGAGTLEESGSDGVMLFGNGVPSETTVVSYKVCYEDFPDRCARGNVAIATESPISVASSSRQGIATLYEVNWVGRTFGCDNVQPTLLLSCSGEGEISTISAGLNNDIGSCTNTTAGLLCNAGSDGTVYVQCRDVRSSDNMNRQLVASVSSSPVSCATSLQMSPPFTASHSVDIQTWCNGSFVQRNMTCSGELLRDATSGSQTCFGSDTVIGTVAQPSDITAISQGFEDCLVVSGSPIPFPILPNLTAVGDADGEAATGYPLGLCQSDCDDDSECAGDLICFQRSSNEIVPGCIGTPEEGRDYCTSAPIVLARSGAGSFP